MGIFFEDVAKALMNKFLRRIILKDPNDFFFIKKSACYISGKSSNCYRINIIYGFDRMEE